MNGTTILLRTGKRDWISDEQEFMDLVYQELGIDAERFLKEWMEEKEMEIQELEEDYQTVNIRCSKLYLLSQLGELLKLTKEGKQNVLVDKLQDLIKYIQEE